MRSLHYGFTAVLIVGALAGCHSEQLEGDTVHRSMNVPEVGSSAQAQTRSGVSTAMPEISRNATVLTEADNKGSIAVEANTEIVIKLPGNPTTGYSWTVSNYDSNVLSLGSHEYYAGATNLVGSGGTFIFRFQAIAPGETTVKLNYSRPWEKKGAGSTFSNDVTVE